MLSSFVLNTEANLIRLLLKNIRHMRDEVFSFRHVYVVRLHPQSANDEVRVLEAALLMFNP